MAEIESRENRAMRPLLEFYAKQTNFKQLLDVLVFKKRNIPLRLLDWFVTNYSKKNDVCYNIIRPNGQIEVFRVFRSYRAQLKGSKKKEFDPFCRGKIITLEYDSEPELDTEREGDRIKLSFETALCQLKFFRWAIENLILDYIENHYDTIYNDMKQFSSKSLPVKSISPTSTSSTSSSISSSISSSTSSSSATSSTTSISDSGSQLSTRKKKTELSKSIFQQMCVSHQNVVLDFRNKNQMIEVI